MSPFATSPATVSSSIFSPLELEEIVERKVSAIITTLLNEPEKLFHLNSLAESANVPVSSTARIIKRLVESKHALEVKIGKISVYRAKLPSIENVKKLIEPKTLAVLTALLNNPGKLFHLNSLAKSANVPVSSTSRIIRRLVSSGFADEIKIGKISAYKIADNEKVKKLKEVI